MWGNGEAKRIVRKGSGKRVVGINKPERSSSARYFALRIPRIDLVRIATSPTAKLIAATRKNERVADRRKRAPASAETGGLTGKSRPMTIPIGRVKRTARKADWPAASAIMTVWKSNGLI